VLSDAPANARGEGRDSARSDGLRVTVDRTPPGIELDADSGLVRVVDELSALRHVKLVRDGVPLFALRPEDGLCDSPNETFRLRWDGPAAAVVLRADDVEGNSSERALSGAAE